MSVSTDLNRSLTRSMHFCAKVACLSGWKGASPLQRPLRSPEDSARPLAGPCYETASSTEPAGTLKQLHHTRGLVRYQPRITLQQLRLQAIELTQQCRSRASPRQHVRLNSVDRTLASGSPSGFRHPLDRPVASAVGTRRGMDRVRNTAPSATGARPTTLFSTFSTVHVNPRDDRSDTGIILRSTAWTG